MKFGVREICDVVLKAKANQKVGNKIFYKGEPVIYFDTLKTSSMEGAATTVYAQGGRGNARLMAWEGERTVTFTMEDALISPAGFMILSGAGLIEATAEKTIAVHATEQTNKVGKSAGLPDGIYQIDLENVPSIESAADIFVMRLDANNGEVVTEPYKAVAAACSDDGDYAVIGYSGEAANATAAGAAELDAEDFDDDDVYIYNKDFVKSEESSKTYARKSAGTDKYIYITLQQEITKDLEDKDFKGKACFIGNGLIEGYTLKTGETHFANGDVVLVDYYVDKAEGTQQIEITPDKFGGNYYLEASTLFKNTDGVDMPAEFIIPNCKIQSNFTFSMASTGDPSTFTFTMDAFPDYTKFDKTKKVLAAIQITNEANNADVYRDMTSHNPDHEDYFK